MSRLLLDGVCFRTIMMERFSFASGRGSLGAALLGLACFGCAVVIAGLTAADEPTSQPNELFARPALPAAPAAEADQILIVSSRGLGTRCQPSLMAAGLRCEEYRCDDGWRPVDWDAVSSTFDDSRPTIIYVHGNRVDYGYSRSHGLSIYRNLAARRSSDQPIRFIIWSWPSSQISGRIRDYQVKAARTTPVGWQLAWMIDQLPDETPVAVVGYSFGARVASGALHLLAGGRLGQYELAKPRHPNRNAIRAAFVAAAFDADWLRPGGRHGRALEQVDQLLLVNNPLDPAMRFYHLAMDGNARPLGYAGGRGFGSFADRVRSIDVSGAVGRHHAIEEYLASSDRVANALAQAAQFPATSELNPAAEALAAQK